MDEQKKEHSNRMNDFENKFKETIKGFQSSQFSNLLKLQMDQIISLILVLLGLVLLFINHLLGDLLIGSVVGYHFSATIFSYIRHMSNICYDEEKFKYLLLTGLMLPLVISSPGILIGAAAMAIVKKALSN